jgi:DNA-directed RNA polymerase I, II, and III subunit RPABC1
MITVFFILNVKLNIDIIRPFFLFIDTNQIRHVFIVHSDEMTVSARKILSNINARIELFSVVDLQYNPTKHDLVPRHTRVSREGVKEIDKFPTLRIHDPIARYYGYSSGDLIRIERKNRTIYFRVVR